MNEETAQAHPAGNTPGVYPVWPSQACRAEACEIAIHIGVFFDGTGNKRNSDEARRAHSNIARLYLAYPLEPVNGYYPIYIPGVGTPFPEIGEIKPETFGEAFGAGGDGRINFGLLHVFNSIHQAISPQRRLAYTDSVIKALCRNGRRGRFDDLPSGDEMALNLIGYAKMGGLLLDANGQAPQRTSFFRQQARIIGKKIRETQKPKLKEIFIDVFGFSRGAAEARVFCSWLDEIFDGDALCGVKATIRFLGIFDTVASVGIPASTGIGADGHLSWADAPPLRIPARVKNCVHYLAMHENRGSFPVESVRQEGVLPANCREFMFPGMHSDVGGGYPPGEQGRDPGGRDSEKLSQIPLECMYDAARIAKVPLHRKLAEMLDGNSRYDPFEVHDTLRAAYQGFLAECGTTPRTPREWLLPYLAWRYQVRDHYTRLPWASRASAPDRDDLAGANAKLLADIDALEATGTVGGKLWQEVLRTSPLTAPFSKSRTAGRLAPESRAVLALVKSHQPVSAAFATLFADYVHDSHAGFKPFDKKIAGLDLLPGTWEPEGYLRWRRSYGGDDRQLTRQDQAGFKEVRQA